MKDYQNNTSTKINTVDYEEKLINATKLLEI